jgi:hypothetical protein
MRKRLITLGMAAVIGASIGAPGAAPRTGPVPGASQIRVKCAKHSSSGLALARSAASDRLTAR